MKLKEGKKMKKEIIGLTDMCNSQKGTPSMILSEGRAAPGLSFILVNEKQLDDVNYLIQYYVLIQLSTFVIIIRR